jgi:hypothetical protein
LQIEKCLIDLENAEKTAAQEPVVTAKWVNTETRDQSQSGSQGGTRLNGLLFRGTSLIISAREGSPVLEV